ncbi:MAG TPA: folate-binding protein [Rubrivivax sp.]|nr:folate-binding protein [Rubrivivax sp.]
MHGAVRLHDWGVIRASGAEARKFLQGQLTQDMNAVAEGQARLAGFCSAKGRLQASFVIWQGAADEFLLACSADVLTATLKRLSMFVLRAKCKLSDASAEVPLWGLAGAAELDQMPLWSRRGIAGAELIRLPDATVAGQAVTRGLRAGTSPPAMPELHAETWRWLEAASGVPRIVAATVEQFVPQMINLELVGGVDFQKGCYPGQEVIARSQYRGTLKRRAFVVLADAPLQPGQEVFHSDDATQPAGMVVLGGSHAGQYNALVELKIAAAQGVGSLHAGSVGGPRLALGELPYRIPAAE